MRLRFFDVPHPERQVYFQEVAGRRGLSPVIVEKDFWVCYMLRVLFASTFGDGLVFKGGTSLSKVFGIIQRFSEDIDLSLSPDLLGMSHPETGGISRKQAEKWMGTAQAACAAFISEQMQPELERVLTEDLGSGEDLWTKSDMDTTTHSPVILFQYPTEQISGVEYIKRSVKLEFGSLTDQQPLGRHPVRPWLADETRSVFDDWNCEVVSLELERTFWEKATILHVEYHRPEESHTPDRYSRHYADMAALAEHPLGRDAAAREDLRERVVNWKSKFFARGWARYDLAKPGTFKLVPPQRRMSALENDYRAMKDMYFGEPVPFDQVMTTLEALEREINGGGGE